METGMESATRPLPIYETGSRKAKLGTRNHLRLHTF